MIGTKKYDKIAASFRIAVNVSLWKRTYSCVSVVLLIVERNSVRKSCKILAINVVRYCLPVRFSGAVNVTS